MTTTMTAERPQLLTVGETAALLNCSRSTVYRLIHSGTVDALRLGDGQAGIRIPRDALFVWLYDDPRGAA